MILKPNLGRIFASLVCSSLMISCASNDEVDPDTLPTPIVEIENQISIDQVWQHNISDGVQNYYSRLNPEIAYGKIFAASRSGDVFAFDKDTGTELWQVDVRETKNGFWQIFWFDDKFTARVTGLTASYESLYIGTEDGVVIALNEATGEEIWRVKVEGEVLAKPEVEDGNVFLQTSSGLLYALNARTGEVTWQTESEVPVLSLRGASSPVFAGGGILTGGANGKLNVYLASTGQLAWDQAVAKPSGSTELERVVDVDSTPLVIGANVYTLSYGGTLAAMDVRNGRVVWKREYAGFENMTSMATQLFLIDNESTIYAIDRRNGIELWSSQALRNRKLTAPVIQNGKLVVADFEGYLHWLDIDSGDIVGQLELNSSGYYSSGVIDDNRLYIQSRDGELTTIDLK